MPAATTNARSSNSNSDLSECIKCKDFLGLKSIGIHQGFASNNTTRLRCYSILLGCGGLDVYDVLGEGQSVDYDDGNIDLYNNSYSKLIGRDVKRNGYSRWNKTSNYSLYQKNYDLNQIEKLLNVVFTEYSEFNYIQSFDSVFSVFYLIANGNLFIAKKMIVSYLHIFKSDLSLKCDNFGQLTSIWSLLKEYDCSFYRWLKSIICDEDNVSFALEWYISWFSHSSITDFDLILRIYDFMISTQNQQIGLYMVIAVLLNNKKNLMENVENLTDFMLYTKNNIKFNGESIENLISKCYEIQMNEMKKEQRRNSWKQNKMELIKTWKEFKKASKSLSTIFLL